jgi:peptide/nickel transport system permease protein
MRRDGRAALRVGVCLLAALAVAAVAVAGDPYRTDLAGRLLGPSLAHPCGQDGLGRDVLARILVGARLSLGIGVAVVALSLAIGVTVGAVAGYAGGWTDAVLARLIDVFLAFPGLLLAIAIAAVRGPGAANVVGALAALGWTGYARLARGEIARLRRYQSTEAARALGASPLRIVVVHLLPAAVPALLVQATFGVSGAILAEASLSFLGVGVAPPAPSWGAMLDEGRQFLLVAPHLVVWPGAALALTVLALQLVGDGLRDRLDVRTNTRQRWHAAQ